MTTPAPRPSGTAPALSVLAGLTAAVLVGHWFALGGQLPNWWSTHPNGAADPSTVVNATTAAPAATATGLPPPPLVQDRPAPVAISTVRWIVPAPPPPPPAPPPPPKKAQKKPKPPPPPEPPEPEPEPEVFAQVLVPPVEEPITEPIPDMAPPPPIEAIEAADEPVTPPVADSALVEAEPSVLDDAHGGTAAAAPLPPAQLPPNANLSYAVAAKVKGFEFSAGGELNWSEDGSRYEARMEVSAFLLGSIVQTSTGSVSATGLAPERFSDKRRKEKTAEFNRESQRIRYSSNAKVDTLLAGAQDQVSISLQLGGLLNANPQYTEGQTLSLPVSGASSTETWRFDIGPQVALDLPAGGMITRVLTRQPRRAGDKKVQIWLAPDLYNLPVRIRISEPNGDFIDQSLDKMPPIPGSTTPSPPA